MMLPYILGAAAAAMAFPANGNSDTNHAVLVHSKVPHHAGKPVLQPFVSFSIEFAWFPDFAGNKSHPNHFSNHLLENLGDLQGARPIVRVGGNTQDYAVYDPTLETARSMTIIPSIAPDYPRYLNIGTSYFESYSTFPDTKFIHGFNMGQNGSEGMESLLATATLACKALQGGKLEYWELGNEPDQFTTTDRGTRRPGTWSDQDYVDEWLKKTTDIRKKMEESCPRYMSGRKYIAPSLANLGSDGLNPVTVWRDGLNKHENIALDSAHNYMGGADEPGVTLQKTLMNHTAVVNKVAQHLNVTRILNSENLTPDIPYILGEMNSLYNQGAPGLSNSFGASLWGVDFNLYCASQDIRRTHMHQGLDYRYAAWQPIETKKTTIGTKAPYYGNAMVAAMMRGGDDVRIVNLPLEEEMEAAYAAYVAGKLARIAVVNMREFNYSVSEPEMTRPSKKYEFKIPGANGELEVQRLMANGSNALSGVTWDGWSYNYELEAGKPVRMHNVTVGETVQVDGQGLVKIEVPYSSGAILNI